MENVERKTFNRAIRSRTTHQSFFHAFRNLQTTLSLSRVHSLLQPQLLDNSFPPSYDREKKISFSKHEAHPNSRMTPLNSAFTLFLLLASLPVTRMTPLHNAKTQVRIALLFAEAHGLIDTPREGGANDASDHQTNKRYNVFLKDLRKNFHFYAKLPQMLRRILRTDFHRLSLAGNEREHEGGPPRIYGGGKSTNLQARPRV